MAGIYKITNKITNEFYIGSTTRNFIRRKTQHLNSLSNGSHKNYKLQRDYKRYGKDSFIFEELEFCDKFDCIRLEQKYIDTLNPTYNICKIAKSCLGVKRSEKFKENLRLRQEKYFNSQEKNKEHLSKCNSKYIYKILTKDGDVILESQLKTFCAKNKLKRARLASTHIDSKAKKIQQNHNGFKILEKYKIEEILAEYNKTGTF